MSAEGFLGSELLRSEERSEEFITIDRWDSREAFVGFMADCADQYAELDERYAALTLMETRLGAFSL